MPTLTSLIPEPIKAPLRRMRRRRIHVYGVGAARTGTTTLASMFGHSYRAAHEADAARLIDLAIDGATSSASDAPRIRQAVVARDRRLHLEVEASHALAYVVDHLADAFPEARFIVTIREPLPWLRSRVAHHDRAKTTSTAWQPYRDFFLHGRQGEFAEEERELEARGLCSLDVYLAQYADHYRRVFAAIEPSRRLVVRTHELNGSPPRIADFLGIQADTLAIAHEQNAPKDVDPLATLDPDFVRSRIVAHSAEIVRDFFPESLASYGL